jgi:hypothetical protein
VRERWEGSPLVLWSFGPLVLWSSVLDSCKVWKVESFDFGFSILDFGFFEFSNFGFFEFWNF